MARKLRIAWSVGCGIVCLLLIVLWVRSYWLMESLTLPTNTGHVILISSNSGVVYLVAEPTVITTTWGYSRGGVFRAVRSFKFELTNELVVRFPHWFVALLCATLAIAPWIKWRFSLRTLLVTTTLVAVLLVAIIYTAK